MTRERECERCKGSEILLLTDSGALFSWRNSRGARDVWFCPNCDWGSEHRGQHDQAA